MNPQLSERAKNLIPKARIVSFAGWEKQYPSEVIQFFQEADDEGRYLTDSDLEQIQTLSPNASATLIAAARFLRENAPELVAEARKQILEQYPDIVQPGGGLYPPERAENCWRDLWHFLRCITYGIAGHFTRFSSSEGLHNMELLYQELRVPLDAMVLGLESLKASSLKRFEPNEQEILAPYFDHLIAALKGFSSGETLQQV